MIALAERTTVVVDTSLLKENTAQDEAQELLSEHGFPDATVVLVRSAGDTCHGCEEIWFRDQYGRKILATLVPVERKRANGSKYHATGIDIEYGW